MVIPDPICESERYIADRQRSVSSAQRRPGWSVGGLATEVGELPQRQVFGPHRMIAVLGGDGMGNVYLAQRTDFGPEISPRRMAIRVAP
jgi:hypothetical protein